MEMSSDGYTVSHNGVTITKPDYMDDDYWFLYEAPRVGKYYGGKTNSLYGSNHKKVTHGEDEIEDGCGGACSI